MRIKPNTATSSGVTANNLWRSLRCRKLSRQSCEACHTANGGGNIGTNLTDNAWIHGGRATQIYRVVLEGVPAKGMVAWGPQLGDERVQSVVAYVLTLRNTNVPGGKAPQGDVMAE